MSRTDKFLCWLPAGLYALVIFSSSATPAEFLPAFFPGSDKIIHFFEYLPFGLLVFRGFFRTAHISRLRSLLITIFVVILYSLSDETHQLFVPGRQFDLLDAFFDVCGATAGSLLYLWRS